MKKLLIIGAVVGLGLIASVLTSGCLSDVFNAKHSERPFTVCSFNMRTDCGADKDDLTWANRLPRVFKVIEDHHLDVIGAQELKENQVVHLRECWGRRDIRWLVADV